MRSQHQPIQLRSNIGPGSPGRVRRHLALALATGLLVAAVAGADPFPPDWSGGGGAAVHHAPVAWPSPDGDGELDYGNWIPYTMVATNLEDQSIQDPSNGGTSPQNYVNISSGCVDLTIPSIFYGFDPVSEVIFFRWRVEQIAHTYATGPSARTPAGATDPWKSALWTVLIDIDGDGYREFAAHIDGSSGTPGAEVDRISFIYSDTPSHSIDYVNDPDICLLGHNPTAFTDGPADSNTGRILNFQNSVTPVNSWPLGAAESLWDYGTTRARLLTHGGICDEYFVDYQIPIAALDASSTPCAGPAMTADTPFRVFFATANSLNNPLQKDVVLEGEFTPGDEEIPFGDAICMSCGGTLQQPIVQAVTTSGCGPATLSANVVDTLELGAGGTAEETIASVDFYYWDDANGNGLADDAGSSWLWAAAAASVGFGTWEASWDSTTLGLGQYLIGVRAEDDQGNITWSHLTVAEAALLGTPPNYANPTADPGVVYGGFINVCGTSPSATKSASVSEVVAGGTVDFTITVNASLVAALSVSAINDTLPPGWTYASDQGGTLVPTTSPVAGSSGTITWTFAPAAVIAAGGNGTLIFRATAPAVVGTYTNVGEAVTGEGNFATNPAEVGVGAPQLTLAKSVAVAAANPGDTVSYTITYSNDSPVGVTNGVITDILPIGLTFVSATDGGSYDVPTRTITWNVGDLPSGSGTSTVSFTVTVDNPYPPTAEIPLPNTAEINSDQTGPDTADASLFVNSPRPDLVIQKDADLTQVTPAPPLPAPGGNVNFTITYANVGNADAYNVVITDPVPAGWSFVSASPPGVFAAGTVTWTLGTVTAGTTATVSTILNADPGVPANPTTNTATIDGTIDVPGLIPLAQRSDDFDVGIIQSACATPTTFYFHNATIDPGTGTLERTATTTAGVNPGTFVSSPVTVAQIDFLFFYEDPVSTVGSLNSTTTTVTYWAQKTQGNPTVHLTLYDYDPVTDTRVQLGAGTGSAGGTVKEYTITWTAAWTATVPAGHRLEWVFGVSGSNSSQIDVHFDGVTTSNSRSNVCRTPLSAVVDKQTSSLAVTPGSPPLTLTYTIKFGNTGRGTLSGAQIVDTLPPGVTYSTGNATLNTGGSAVAVEPQEGNGCTTCTFDVSTSDLTPPAPGPGAGILTGAQSGQLTITVGVDNPMAAGILSLVNNATLRANEIADLNDSTTTSVLRPIVTIEKSADQTLLIPGSIVTYNLLVTSVGRGTASSLTITDDLNPPGPLDTYFLYVGASCTVDTTFAPSTGLTSCSEAAGVITATADQLVVGETLLVTFQMQVQTVPAPPSGVTNKNNFASVVDSTTDPASPIISNAALASISTNANLLVTKATAAADPLAPGQTVTYTLTVENAGWSDTEEVTVTDPIPANTSYVLGSLVYDAASQSDPDDADTGRFDAVSNQVVFEIGTMAYTDLHTLSFDVVVDSPLLPTGTTSAPVANTMTATASNTATKEASADRTAQGVPVLSLTKSAPTSMAWPLTTLAAAAAATTVIQVNEPWMGSVDDYVTINGVDAQILAIGELLTRLNGDHLVPTTTVNVVDASGIAVGDRLSINGTITNVTAKVGNQLTVDTAITAQDGYSVSRPADTWTLSAAVTDVVGANVWGVITYTLRYLNTGNVAATSTTIDDPVPAGTTFVAADSGGSLAAGVVSWNIGTVEPGAGGSVRFWARPNAQATFSNSGTIDSTQTAPTASNNTQTDVGGLRPWKTTSTYPPVPVVINDLATNAQVQNYVITITNNNPVLATDVEVTDDFSPGFSFNSNFLVTWGGGSSRTAVVDPVLGDNPARWCCWDLAAGDTLRIEFVADISNDVGSGNYQNGLTCTSTNIRCEEFDELLTDQDDVSVLWLGPNHVFVRSFAALIGDHGDVVVRWETDVEIRTLGFFLLRWEHGRGEWAMVRDELLPALVATPQGGTYRVADGDALIGEPLSYLLVEVESDGNERIYGPFEVTAVDEAAERPQAAAAIAGEGWSATPQPLRVAPKASSELPVTIALTSGDGLRIGVREPGLYRLEALRIASALGKSWRDAVQLIRSGHLRLTLEDREVPWTVAEGRGKAMGILFYGEGTDSIYTRDRIYLLTEGRGTMIGHVAGAPHGGAEPGASFHDTLRFAEDHVPLVLGSLDPEEDLWFWDYVIAGQESKRFELEVPGVGSGSPRFRAPQLTVHLKGAVDTGLGEHRVRVLLNGETLGERTFSDFERRTFTFAVNPALLREGQNTVELVAVSEPEVVYSIFYVERIELWYERSYQSSQPEFFARNEGHDLLTLTGFTETDLQLYDISDPWDPKLVQGARIEQGPWGDIQVSFTPASANAQYLAVTSAGIREPASLRVDHFSDLASSANWADYLIITTASLHTAAERLADHRQSQGLKAMVIDVDDIMDEWNGSQFDPRALHAFLVHAHTQWWRSPRYVALVGEGTFDYKDAWGLGTNVLPPLMVAAGWGLYASDNRLADLVGEDGVPEVAIGRIPVETATQLDAYVDKVIAYELDQDQSWTGQVLLAADNPDATGQYTIDSDSLAALIPPALVKNRIYLGQMGIDDASAALMQTLNAGVPLVTYLGHAGLTQLAHEGLLRSSDVPGLTNAHRVPVVAVLGCYLGNFSLPGYPTLGEDLVLHAEGGAAAVWSAAGVSYNPHRLVLGQAFLEAIFERGIGVVGDAVLYAQGAAAARLTGNRRDILDSQVLLGDPALRLKTKQDIP